MPDQIFAPGPNAAPFKYTVPGSQRMIPRAFQANFDGSGASGAYLPTVVIRSQAGHVIARAILESTVAGGDDAEVSWFPGVKHGGAGTTIAWGILSGVASVTVITGDPANGNLTFVDFTGGGVTEDGSGTFFFDPAQPNYLQCRAAPAPAVFSVVGYFQHDNGTPSLINPANVRGYLRVASPVGGGEFGISSQTVFGANSGQPGDPNNLYSFGLSGFEPNGTLSTPVGFEMIVENFDTALHPLNLTNPRLAVALVGVG